jgi:hypothetical protein
MMFASMIKLSKDMDNSSRYKHSRIEEGWEDRLLKMLCFYCEFTTRTNLLARIFGLKAHLTLFNAYLSINLRENESQTALVAASPYNLSIRVQQQSAVGS